jgi:hypothetical protein
LGLVERVLVYRVKERRFCLFTHKKQKCFGICRIVLDSDIKGLEEICPIYVAALDEVLNG